MNSNTVTCHNCGRPYRFGGPGCCETLRLPEYEPYVLDIKPEPAPEEHPMRQPSPTTEAEARAIWASMDEWGRLLMAKTAPMTVGPWCNRYDEEHFRLLSKTGKAIAVVDLTSVNDWTTLACNNWCGTFGSLRAAKSAVDAKLRELGYVLEDE